MVWVRIPLETYIFILNFSLPPLSEQVNGVVANEIKHVHSPEVIVVLDPRYNYSYKALYISTCSIALSYHGLQSSFISNINYYYYFYFQSNKSNTKHSIPALLNFPRDLNLYLPCLQEAQRATYRAPEYNVQPFWLICQGGHLFFSIGPKDTNLVEDIEILLPVKFR